MAREVIIDATIDTDGNVTFDVQNMQGQGCREATRTLEDAIGKVTKRTDKPELYMGDGQGVSIARS